MKPTVLIVDDSKTAGKAAELDLTLAGFDAKHELRAMRAVARIAEGERWDVLVLDVQQPDVSGDKLAEMILQYIPDQVILLHSAMNLNELNHLSLRIGVPYCPKGAPLAKCVRDLVEQQRKSGAA